MFNYFVSITDVVGWCVLLIVKTCSNNFHSTDVGWRWELHLHMYDDHRQPSIVKCLLTSEACDLHSISWSGGGLNTTNSQMFVDK